MIDIIKALNENTKEAKKLLKGKGEVMLAKWNDDSECYEGNDGEDINDVGIYIRYADDDGNIATKLVVGVKYNEGTDHISIITAEDEYTESDNHWFPMLWCDDISYWNVLSIIGKNLEEE